MSKIYLIRHGESLANAGGVTKNSQDIPLTDLGREQAKLVPPKLPQHIDEIYYSTFCRTEETAKPTIEAHPEAKVQVWADLHEFDYLKPEAYFNTTLEERQPIAKLYWQQGDPYLRNDPTVESFADLNARVHRVWQRLEKDYAGKDKVVVAFTHALFLKAFFQVKNKPEATIEELMHTYFECPVISNCEIFELSI